tara:strand:- start:11 stop:1417 length:1407 start_codon:yes stop_codon:yes gene_type:complete
MRTYCLNAFKLLSINLLFIVTINAADLPDFTSLAEDSSQAVVNIRSSKTISNSRFNQFGDRGFNNPQYDEFFKRFFGDPKGRGPRERNVSSAGSGFIISEDGYILTNSHVVEGADEIKVSLSDRREYEAILVGLDEKADVALLKIKAEGLPQVKIGTSDLLKVGEWVVAIGSPFQLNFSVTAGIVSAKGRSIPNGSDSTYVPFIQTDVAINPGNSGGPLFNLSGEVVGINSQIYTRSGGYMGVSFSIPIDYAMDIADQLRSQGKVSRGWLGVSIQEITSDLAEGLGLDSPKGALVSQVMPDSPAEKAGLKERDVIIEFDGNEIIYSGDLPQTVGAIKPDTKVSALVYRDGRKKQIKVVVGELSSNSSPELSQESSLNPLGLSLKSLSSEDKRNLKILNGVKVIGIEADSIAFNAGIKIGDVITSLANKSVRTETDFLSIVNKLEPGKNFTIRIIRNGNAIFFSLKLLK